MAKNGPIVIVEDDTFERSLYLIAFRNLNVPNEIHFFENGRLALDYLETTKDNPFLIICDMSMPVMEGLEMRERIAANPYLTKKATPFIFRTGSATTKDIHKSYELMVQGFFTKSPDYEHLEQQLAMILGYWKECLEPNDEV